MTVTSKTRQLLHYRSGGMCEVCGRSPGTNVHHRRARGMGGTKRNIHTCEWLLYLCGSGTTGCHGLVEAGPESAYINGWKLRHHQRPETSPVRVFGNEWVILTPQGTYKPWWT